MTYVITLKAQNLYPELMAIFHMHINYGNRARASASAKFAYVSALDKYAKKTPEIAYAEDQNMPVWSNSSAQSFWGGVDKFSSKKAIIFNELEFALPRELSAESRAELASDFAKNVGGNHPYSLRIHDKKSGNPHAHLVINQTLNDGIDRPAHLWFKNYKKNDIKNGGARKEKLTDRKFVKNARKTLEETINRHLEKNGISARVSCASLKNQGIDRTPTKHRGWAEKRAQRNVKKLGLLRDFIDSKIDEETENEQRKNELNLGDGHKEKSRAISRPEADRSKEPSREIKPEDARSRSENRGASERNRRSKNKRSPSRKTGPRIG